jgi:20S proteasome subunit alpha 7
VCKLSHIYIHFSVEITNYVFCFSIYLVHDELKDKQFELELSWVGVDTKGVFQRVPQSVFQEAEKSAKAAMEAESDSDTEDM